MISEMTDLRGATDRPLAKAFVGSPFRMIPSASAGRQQIQAGVTVL